VFNVGATLSAASEHEGHLHEHLAPVVAWGSLVGVVET